MEMFLDLLIALWLISSLLMLNLVLDFKRTSESKLTHYGIKLAFIILAPVLFLSCLSAKFKRYLRNKFNSIRNDYKDDYGC